MSIIKLPRTKLTTGSLRDRIVPSANDTCLLLDTSGSMLSSTDSGEAKHDALQRLVDDFPGARKFVFGNIFEEVLPGQYIPRPRGATFLAEAFFKLRPYNIHHIILITDGRPTEPNEDVLAAAQGYKVDCFYVGPAPAPELLRQLANQTGGSYGSTNLGSGRAQLKDKITGLLGSPEEKGPIQL